LPSPSKFTLDDFIFMGCDAASLGNWPLTFWALKLMPLYLEPITCWCDIISQKNGIVSNTTVKGRNLHIPADRILPWKVCCALDIVHCLTYVLYTCLGMWNFSCFQAMNFNCTDRSMLLSIFVMLVIIVVYRVSVFILLFLISQIKSTPNNKLRTVIYLCVGGNTTQVQCVLNILWTVLSIQNNCGIMNEWNHSYKPGTLIVCGSGTAMNAS
jgi:hypothetical protein